MFKYEYDELIECELDKYLAECHTFSPNSEGHRVISTWLDLQEYLLEMAFQGERVIEKVIFIDLEDIFSDSTNFGGVPIVDCILYSNITEGPVVM